MRFNPALLPFVFDSFFCYFPSSDHLPHCFFLSTKLDNTPNPTPHSLKLFSSAMSNRPINHDMQTVEVLDDMQTQEELDD
jgi:hypothetical protein